MGSHEQLQEKPKRKKYPRRVPMDKETDVAYGDPYEVFGIDILYGQFDVDAQVYTIKPDALIGKLKVGDDWLPLTAEVKRRAIRLVQHDETGLATGKVVYMIYPDLYPYSTLQLEGVPIEHIDEDWPVDVEFPEHSLVAEITRPEAKTLAVSVERWWRARGGHPDITFDKSGGRKLKDA